LLHHRQGEKELDHKGVHEMVTDRERPGGMVNYYYREVA